MKLIFNRLSGWTIRANGQYMPLDANHAARMLKQMELKDLHIYRGPFTILTYTI